MLEKILLSTIFLLTIPLCNQSYASAQRTYNHEPIHNSPIPEKKETFMQQYAIKEDRDLSEYIKPIRNDLD